MSTTFSHLNGVKVFTSPLAVKQTWKTEVRKHPAEKRRRRWAVVRFAVETPCVIQTPLGLFVHPSIYAQFRKQAHEYIATL
ncbi:MAG: hypothetical protein J7556_14825 [Acidovorax sp.]|nr:hypothetical protein [Acidovorax sp.]